MLTDKTQATCLLRQLWRCYLKDPCHLYTYVVISRGYFPDLGTKSKSVILVNIAELSSRGHTIFFPPRMPISPECVVKLGNFCQSDRLKMVSVFSYDWGQNICLMLKGFLWDVSSCTLLIFLLGYWSQFLHILGKLAICLMWVFYSFKHKSFYHL